MVLDSPVVSLMFGAEYGCYRRAERQAFSAWLEQGGCQRNSLEHDVQRSKEKIFHEGAKMS